eukprot:12192528-Ditylum_brightwellii.AAC.1
MGGCSGNTLLSIRASTEDSEEEEGEVRGEEERTCSISQNKNNIVHNIFPNNNLVVVVVNHL